MGKPDAVGYHKARGLTPNGHLGEDWDGDGGGNTDLGDPIYVIGHGIVVLARDMRWAGATSSSCATPTASRRKAARSRRSTAFTATWTRSSSSEGEQVTRGQQIATMGTAHGLYDAHLHFEIRKNITVGMYRSAFPRDFTTYYDPTQFVLRAPRSCAAGAAAR